ncbi:MAG: ABC transporter substrate-binding protein, partial [Flavobacteriaceae bacterium]
MKQSQINITGFLSIAWILFLVISCGNNAQQDRDFKVFRYNEHSNITSLDPAFARNPQNIWPTNQLFNG